MQYTLLLDKNENVRQIEAEEQTRFLFSLIEAMEIPFQWDPNEEFTVLDRIRLRKTLSDYNISVIDDMAGGMKIYLERDLIGEWNKASYMLKEDLSQLDPKKRLYIQMECKFKSMFEEEGKDVITEPD